MLNEFQSELSVLAVHLRSRAQARLAANKADDLRDEDVFNALQEIAALRADGKLLDAVAKETEAYKICLSLELKEML